LINLDKSKDRLEKSQQRLGEQSVTFERISGVLGSALTQEQLRQHYDSELNSRNYHYQLTRNQIGCYLSHRKAWQKIADGDAPFGVVLEDDFYLSGDLHAAFDQIGKIAFPWDLIKLAAYQNRDRKIKFEHSLSNGLKLVVHSKPMSGGAATAITKEGANKLLKSTQKFGRPVDTDIQYFWEKGITVMSLMPYPVTQDLAFESTIAASSETHKKHFWRRKIQQFEASLLNYKYTNQHVKRLRKQLSLA